VAAAPVPETPKQLSKATAAAIAMLITPGSPDASQVNSTDLNKLTVVKLRAALEARGLDASGLKPVLVERLAAAIQDSHTSATVSNGGDGGASGDVPTSAEAASAAESMADLAAGAGSTGESSGGGNGGATSTEGVQESASAPAAAAAAPTTALAPAPEPAPSPVGGRKEDDEDGGPFSGSYMELLAARQALWTNKRKSRWHKVRLRIEGYWYRNARVIAPVVSLRFHQTLNFLWQYSRYHAKKLINFCRPFLFL